MRGLLGPEVEETGEEVAEGAGQDVDVEFLIGPVALRSQGDVDGVLEVGKDGFDGRLAAVGVDDLGGDVLKDAPFFWPSRRRSDSKTITVRSTPHRVRRVRKPRTCSSPSKETGRIEGFASATRALWLEAEMEAT